MLTAFSIEHILIGVMVVLKLVFDRDPFWVRVFMQRRAHKKNEKKYASVKTRRLATALLEKRAA